VARRLRGHTGLIDDLPEFLRTHYEVHERQHATAVLKLDFPKEYRDIVEVLSAFRLKKSEIIKPGGGKSEISKGLDDAFSDRDWEEKGFSIATAIDGEELQSATHSIDCYKNEVGLEIEWNSKDQTFDRDLINFSRLYDAGKLSVGVIVTRCDELQDLFDSLVDAEGETVGRKYGASTTHMSKLLPRLAQRRNGGCPVLVFGISKALYVEGE
jgi:hypothetical protein